MRFVMRGRLWLSVGPAAIQPIYFAGAATTVQGADVPPHRRRFVGDPVR